MPQGIVRASFAFASGSTSTSAQYVGSYTRCLLVVSNMTAFNAGTGNATINLMGGLSSSGNFARIPSATVATHTSLGIYNMANPGMPYLKVEFGTAVTGSAAMTIDAVLACDA